MKSNKSKKSPEKETESEEWDISKGMGIFPDDISFTQNIGCVGGKTKKESNKNTKSTK